VEQVICDTLNKSGADYKAAIKSLNEAEKIAAVALGSTWASVSPISGSTGPEL